MGGKGEKNAIIRGPFQFEHILFAQCFEIWAIRWCRGVRARIWRARPDGTRRMEPALTAIAISF